jgi:hypothetical protein
MTKRQKPVPTRRFYLAGFLAVLVTAIILISGRYADPLVIKSIADLTVAYLAWRVAAEQRASNGGSGPARA